MLSQKSSCDYLRADGIKLLLTFVCAKKWKMVDIYFLTENDSKDEILVDCVQ